MPANDPKRTSTVSLVTPFQGANLSRYDTASRVSGGSMRRLAFIALLGAAAACPLMARAQQPATPVIGFLSSLAVSDQAPITAAFREGLNDAGYVEGRNVVIEYRWAEGQYDRLPTLAADLVSRQVSVIAAISGTPAVQAAKAATTTIPIVFAIGGDPVSTGLVTRLNRPEGNVTGINFFTMLGPKRLGLLRELVPTSKKIALLVDLNNSVTAADGRDTQAAAQAMSLEAKVLNATSRDDIDLAFATIAQERPDALYVAPDPIFLNERSHIIELAARYAVPTVYADREATEAGGLMSYGASRRDAYRRAGVYVGRVLKGEKPAELPVTLPTKFELVINLKAAKALGLTVPPTLLARADEVIE
jgi:putative ABC transport system substrate-binding protein